MGRTLASESGHMCLSSIILPMTSDEITIDHTLESV